MTRATAFVGVLLVAVTLLGVSGGAAPPAVAPAAPTFTQDIAPILYKSCVSCHRTGEMAPMSLISYEEVRPWAKSIKAKVASREMPPWGADPRYGTFKDDRASAPRQIDTIAQLGRRRCAERRATPTCRRLPCSRPDGRTVSPTWSSRCRSTSRFPPKAKCRDRLLHADAVHAGRLRQGARSPAEHAGRRASRRRVCDRHAASRARAA